MGSTVHPSLRTVQQWMQTVIEHPGDGDTAWNSDAAQHLLTTESALAAVLPSATLSPMERIEIYRRMFVLRMTESMAVDYPGVRAALGGEAFDELVLNGYLRAHPSTSYTLDHLGRHFPEYLQTAAVDHPDFLSDLAALELSITRVLEAEESPLLTQEFVAGIPSAAWEDARIVPVEAVELHRFAHPVGRFLEAVNEERDLPGMEAVPSFTVVYRHHYRAYWQELTEPQFTLLELLCSGTRFGAALSALAGRFPADEHQRQDDLSRWFSEWIANGLFSHIHITEGMQPL